MDPGADQRITTVGRSSTILPVTSTCIVWNIWAVFGSLLMRFWILLSIGVIILILVIVGGGIGVLVGSSAIGLATSVAAVATASTAAPAATSVDSSDLVRIRGRRRA